MASLKMSHLVIGKKDRVLLSHPIVKAAIANSPMTGTFHSRVEPHGRVAFGTAVLECAYGLRLEGNLDKRDVTFTSIDLKRSSIWKRVWSIQNRGPLFDANATTCLKYVSDIQLEEVKRITDILRLNSWSGLALLFGLIAGAMDLNDATVFELVARILARIERGEEAAMVFWKTGTTCSKLKQLEYHGCIASQNGWTVSNRIGCLKCWRFLSTTCIHVFKELALHQLFSRSVDAMSFSIGKLQEEFEGPRCFVN
jgi:hypothetical protein